MFEFVRFRSRYAIMTSLLVTLVIDRTYCSNTTNKRKGGVDVFNLLLGLYKLNPLKDSKVFTKFANNVLTHKNKRSFNGKFSSNEIGNTQQISLQQLADIEKVIHPLYKKQIRHSMEKPEFDVENVDTENFNVDIILQDNFENDYKGVDTYSNKNDVDKIDFSNIENMLPNSVPDTKLLPAHQWLLPTSIKRNPKPVKRWFTEYEVHKNKEPNGQLPNKLQQKPIISDNALTPDVVVL